jgi:hypothetical protein
MSNENVVSGIVGSIIGGSVGYKAGYQAGYKKKEQEDQWTIGTLQSRVAEANQTIQNQQSEIEKLKSENRELRSHSSIADRIKGALTS